VEIVEEVGVGAGVEQVEAGAAPGEPGTAAMRRSEHGKIRIKLAQEITIGKGDTTRRWPELAHCDT